MSNSLSILAATFAAVGLTLVLGASTMHASGVLGKAVHATGQLLLLLALITLCAAAIAWFA